MTNTLYVLQGAPGVGKSTFLRRNGLDRYSVSPDAVRGMLEPPHVYRPDTGTVEDGFDYGLRRSSLAFEVVRAQCLYLMRNGSTIILDSTAARRRNIGGILQDAHDHRYAVRFVDMQHGVTLDEALRRNHGRGFPSEVPEDVVRRMYRQCDEYRPDAQKGEEKITPERMLEDMAVRPVDVSGYDRVRFIGDVQGCWNALRKAVADGSGNPLDDPGTLYVITGDMLDRGDDASSVFRFMRMNTGTRNIMYVMGNHDWHLRSYGRADEYDGLPKPTRASIDAILADPSYAGGYKQLRRDASRFLARTKPMLVLDYNGTRVVATHGGLHPDMLLDSADPRTGGYLLGLNPLSDFYYGTGTTIDRGDYDTDIDKVIHDWNDGEHRGLLSGTAGGRRVVQVHGHRNAAHHPLDRYDDVYNLEGGVEVPEGWYDDGRAPSCGRLRYVDLTPDGRFATGETSNWG